VISNSIDISKNSSILALSTVQDGAEQFSFFRKKSRFLGAWAITKTIAFIAKGRRKFGKGFAF
jgi:hypothetical protein